MDCLWVGGNYFVDYWFDFFDIENLEIELFLLDLVCFVDWGGIFWGVDLGVLGDFGDLCYVFLFYVVDQFEDNIGDFYVLCGDVLYEFDGDGWFDFVEFGVCFLQCEQINCNVGLNWGGIVLLWVGGYLFYVNCVDFGVYDVVDFFGFQGGGVFFGDIILIVFLSCM